MKIGLNCILSMVLTSHWGVMMWEGKHVKHLKTWHVFLSSCNYLRLRVNIQLFELYFTQILPNACFTRFNLASCLSFTVSYEQSAITYVWKNDEDTLRKSPSLTTLNAYLIQNQTIACPIKGSWRGWYQKFYGKTLKSILVFNYFLGF
jgi:hypothetical protein